MSEQNATRSCPMSGVNRSIGAGSNQRWWPNQLNLAILHQNSPLSNPMGAGFDYAEAFESLDFDGLAQDVDALMTQSQDWWPADYGNYGPFFVSAARRGAVLA